MDLQAVRQFDTISWWVIRVGLLRWTGVQALRQLETVLGGYNDQLTSVVVSQACDNWRPSLGEDIAQLPSVDRLPRLATIVAWFLLGG